MLGGKSVDLTAVRDVAGGQHRHDQQKWGGGGIMDPHESRSVGLEDES